MNKRAPPTPPAVLAVFVLAAAETPLCTAQSVTGRGTIHGIVKDSGGAAIPRARIAITHAATGAVNTTESNSEGFFATPPIKIGSCRVRVEAQGMKTGEWDLTFETGRSVDLSPVLTVGPVSETVIVTETIPLVTTSLPLPGM